jgi:DDE superfamily endonuclease
MPRQQRKRKRIGATPEAENFMNLCAAFLFFYFVDNSNDMFLLLSVCCFAVAEEVTGLARLKSMRLLCTSFETALSDRQFRDYFRFERVDMQVLMQALAVPTIATLSNGTRVSGQSCLLVLLYKLSYPTTYARMELLFGRSRCLLSRMYTYAANIVYAKFANRLTYFDLDLVQRRLPMYQMAITEKCGEAVTQCFGFLDGTHLQTCRPSVGQEAVYSGHKRHHGLKFQSVVTPDGLLVMFFGPVEGRRHDVTLLRWSNLHDILDHLPAGACIYGDQGYPCLPRIMSPFRGPLLTEAQSEWNLAMRSVRISVEWGFAIVGNLWAHCKFVPQQKFLGTPCAKNYMVAAALSNMHNCLYPNLIAQYFGVCPPSLEQYIGN